MPNGTGRSTGLSLAAILLVAACFAAMVLLHAVRTDLDPVRQVMSEYANGRFGWFMTAAFYAIGLACLALALRLGRAIVRRAMSVVVRVLLGLGGFGLILAGIFEVERPAVPDTIQEVIHSDATLTAFTLIIAAMLLFAVLCRWDPRWHDFRGVATGLAIIAAVAGAFSPFAGQTTWSGMAQRVLGATVVAWLLLCAWHIRFGGLRRSRPEAGNQTTADIVVGDPAPREEAR
jgi:di/tricarboxylate transporter